MYATDPMFHIPLFMSFHCCTVCDRRRDLPKIALDRNQNGHYDKKMKWNRPQALLQWAMHFTMWTILTITTPLHAAKTKSVWQNMRQHFSIDTSAMDHPLVEQKLSAYLRNPGYTQSILKRAEPFLFYVMHEINTRHLPAELALVPFVESEFAANARSKAGALGFWQLMPGTALGMNVHIEQSFDGRKDIIESTRASLNYLTQLYHFFGDDWILALAAYDAGAGRVQHAIKNHHSFLGLSPTIWELNLPRETHHYLPKILALKAIIETPDLYQITLPVVSNTPHFCVLHPKHERPSIHEMQQLSHLSMAQLKILNTGIQTRDLSHQPRHWLLPIRCCLRVTKQLKHFKHHAFMYRVKKGDTLSGIALKQHMSLQQLMRKNHLNSKSIIHPGQRLHIQHHSKHASHMQLPITHQVKHHETLTSIAKHYHVTVQQLRFWNHLTPRHRIRQKSKLTIWSPTFLARTHHPHHKAR